MIDTAWIEARRDEYPKHLWMSRGTRGAAIGRLDTTIREAAREVGLPLGRPRHIRLALASEVYERSVTTFNELTDAELWALDGWVLQREAAGLSDWLRQRFGKQLPLLGGAQSA